MHWQSGELLENLSLHMGFKITKSMYNVDMAISSQAVRNPITVSRKAQRLMSEDGNQ